MALAAEDWPQAANSTGNASARSGSGRAPMRRDAHRGPRGWGNEPTNCLLRVGAGAPADEIVSAQTLRHCDRSTITWAARTELPPFLCGIFVAHSRSADFWC